jgi:hypothetical protein
MRRYILILAVLAGFMMLGALSAPAQDTRTFSDPNVNYIFEIPDPLWKTVAKPTALNASVEMVYGDRMDGFLEVRKMETNADEPLSEVITREQDTKLQFLPGFVSGKEEVFAGNLKGKIFNYEFVRSGKNMTGRIYFLKADAKTLYALRFTGLRDKLKAIRNQTDLIARTFQIK